MPQFRRPSVLAPLRRLIQTHIRRGSNASSRASTPERGIRSDATYLTYGDGIIGSSATSLPSSESSIDSSVLVSSTASDASQAAIVDNNNTASLTLMPAFEQSVNGGKHQQDAQSLQSTSDVRAFVDQLHGPLDVQALLTHTVLMDLTTQAPRNSYVRECNDIQGDDKIPPSVPCNSLNYGINLQISRRATVMDVFTTDVHDKSHTPKVPFSSPVSSIHLNLSQPAVSVRDIDFVEPRRDYSDESDYSDSVELVTPPASPITAVHFNYSLPTVSTDINDYLPVCGTSASIQVEKAMTADPDASDVATCEAVDTPHTTPRTNTPVSGRTPTTLPAMPLDPAWPLTQSKIQALQSSKSQSKSVAKGDAPGYLTRHVNLEKRGKARSSSPATAVPQIEVKAVQATATVIPTTPRMAGGFRIAESPKAVSFAVTSTGTSGTSLELSPQTASQASPMSATKYTTPSKVKVDVEYPSSPSPVVRRPSGNGAKWSTYFGGSKASPLSAASSPLVPSPGLSSINEDKEEEARIDAETPSTPTQRRIVTSHVRHSSWKGTKEAITFELLSPRRASALGHNASVLASVAEEEVVEDVAKQVEVPLLNCTSAAADVSNDVFDVNNETHLEVEVEGPVRAVTPTNIVANIAEIGRRCLRRASTNDLNFFGKLNTLRHHTSSKGETYDKNAEQISERNSFAIEGDYKVGITRAISDAKIWSANTQESMDRIHNNLSCSTNSDASVGDSGFIDQIPRSPAKIYVRDFAYADLAPPRKPREFGRFPMDHILEKFTKGQAALDQGRHVEKAISPARMTPPRSTPMYRRKSCGDLMTSPSASFVFVTTADYTLANQYFSVTGTDGIQATPPVATPTRGNPSPRAKLTKNIRPKTPVSPSERGIEGRKTRLRVKTSALRTLSPGAFDAAVAVNRGTTVLNAADTPTRAQATYSYTPTRSGFARRQPLALAPRDTNGDLTVSPWMVVASQRVLAEHQVGVRLWDRAVSQQMH